MSDLDELDAALRVAFELSRDAVAAGLVVTAMSPQQCHGRYGCHFIQLWQPNGVMWAEGSHETTASVREHIALHRGRVRADSAPVSGDSDRTGTPGS